MTLKEQEMELFNKFKNKQDKQAKKQLLHSLAPLINMQVNKYTNSGLPKLAIELEGMRLAGNALGTYDPSRSQLNTHIVNNLKKLSRFVTDYQNIGHIPEPRALIIGRYKNTYSYLLDKKGRDPTTVEISDSMLIPIKEVERLQDELRSDLYMGNAVTEEDETGFYEFINPADKVSEYKEALDFVYFDASPREKLILESYTGLYNKPKLNSKQIAKKLGINETQLKIIRQKLAKEIKDLM